MATTNIEWTDVTWNPVRGCVKVSPGCKHCYAETFAERWRGVPGHPYEQGFDLRLVPHKLTEPLTWKKPRRVFVNSMSDLFQEGVPDEYIDQVFAVMALEPQHTFQVLTKRAGRMRDYLVALDRAIRLPTTTFPRWRSAAEQILNERGDTKTIVTAAWPLPNVWLGVSVENQQYADERIPLLLQTPAAVRFISAEPLLGPTNLAAFLFGECPDCGTAAAACAGLRRGHQACCPDCRHRRLDWVIVGGESGHGARPFDAGWARAIVAQCKAAGVACFMKQLGVNVVDRNDAGFEGDTPSSWPMDTEIREDLSGFKDGYQGAPVRVILRKKGGDMAEWPSDLRVREFPNP